MNNQEIMEHVDSVTGSVEYTIMNLTPDEIHNINANNFIHSIHIGETRDDPFLVIGLEKERLTLLATERTFADVVYNRFLELGTEERDRMQADLIKCINQRLTELEIDHPYAIRIEMLETDKYNPEHGVIFEVTLPRINSVGGKNFDWVKPDNGKIIEILEKTIGAIYIGVEHLKDFFYDLYLSQSK